MPPPALFHQDTLDWWDEEGPFKALHAITSLRIAWIRDLLCARYQHLTGLKILDVGCGGGLTTEPLTRLGAHVMGIDESAPTLHAAQNHAKSMGLSIPYACTNIERFDTIPKAIQKKFSWTHPGLFDAIVALEIVEHVNDISDFLRACHSWLAPGGLLILSTLNRTPRSFVESIILAEHILKWVPKGAHSWNKFYKPSELVNACQEAGFTFFNLQGFHFDLLTQKWVLSDAIRTNYFLCAERAPSEG